MGRRNVHPSQWGPPAWQFLKSAARACDAESAEAYRAFLQLLPHVLPCERCREHSRTYIAEHPVDVEDLVGWLESFESHVAEEKRKERPHARPNWEVMASLTVVMIVLAVALWLALRSGGA